MLHLMIQWFPESHGQDLLDLLAVHLKGIDTGILCHVQSWLQLGVSQLSNGLRKGS